MPIVQEKDEEEEYGEQGEYGGTGNDEASAQQGAHEEYAHEESGEYGTPSPSPPAQRPPPAAASDPYPAADDGVYRGRPRHRAGADYEHSAYVLVIDKHGRERVGLSFELLTSELLLHDVRTLKAEL